MLSSLLQYLRAGYCKAIEYDGQRFERSEKKTGRNDPCPCGSGKKYKKCCGRDQ